MPRTVNGTGHYREREGREGSRRQKTGPAPAATLASHVARRVGRRPDFDTRRRRRPHRAHGTRRRRGVARDVLVVVLNKIVTQNSHKLEDGVAQPLYVAVRRVYRVREAEEAPLRETADRGLDSEAVAKTRSDGVGAHGLSRYVLR